MATSYLSRIFGSSPVGQILLHMERSNACAGKLPLLFEAAIEQDWDKVKSVLDQITELEHDADSFKKTIRMRLPNALFMPVPRADLLDLVTAQDKIANRARDIAGLLLGRRMVLPAATATTFVELVNRAVDASRQANKTVSELSELFESGFRGTELDVMESMIAELDRIEHDTDLIEIRLRAQLFEIEKSLPPVDVMFLYKIIDWIGELANDAQRVGRRLQLLLAR
jgi:uncharacterized protein